MGDRFDADDHRGMARALRLAARGLFSTDPNPRVGCVLIKDGQVVGEGWHRRAGEPHAEVYALHQAGLQARGATAYVTLEPCCHQGRTPPCSSALIEAGVARVVVAMQDPNPLVAGNGLEQLRRAGIEVACGLLADQARQLNPGFIQRMQEGRPFVRCKLAMSLDGRTAMASGESIWITGEAARQDVHRLRARSSVILTGIGTVLNDDPSLTVRLDAAQLPGLDPELAVPTPLRVVLDSRQRFPGNARMLHLPGRTLIVTAEEPRKRSAPWHQAGVEFTSVPKGPDGLDLTQVLRLLAQRQVNEVLLEAGARLNGGFLRAGLIDELVIYMAPHLMGDAARGLFHLPELAVMADRIALHVEDIRCIGADWRILAKVASDKHQ